MLITHWVTKSPGYADLKPEHTGSMPLRNAGDHVTTDVM
jgi:hypothetical protein